MRLRSYRPASGSAVGLRAALARRASARAASRAVQVGLLVGNASSSRGGCPGQRRASLGCKRCLARLVARGGAAGAGAVSLNDSPSPGIKWALVDLRWTKKGRRTDLYAHNLAEQVRDVVRQIRPSTLSRERARVPQREALEAQLRPHTLGKEGREELHQSAQEPRQV